MPLYDKKIEPLYKIWDTIFSLFRVMRESKFCKTEPMNRNHDKCIILGNGPSLIKTLEANQNNLSNYDHIAVNFFATSPEYVKYKPDKYVLCDPAFWFDIPYGDIIDKVKNLYKTLVKSTCWPLQIFLPYQAQRNNKIKEFVSSNSYISLHYYNKTKYEGWGHNFFYRKQWGMPRAQNVLNAALMLAIYSDYQQIYLAGADNDWVSNVWVDEQNKVRINDTHFYNYEEARSKARYWDMTIDEAMLCFYFAFITYNRINAYAQTKGIIIRNTNPLSYIDVFEKNPQI